MFSQLSVFELSYFFSNLFPLGKCNNLQKIQTAASGTPSASWQIQL